ncbi:protein translocase subunit SecD [Granulicella cerasi]|uniref:Protein translocase subunit SecD n=1 Tax=Granulicella cerasi TaxID=741063 RepID=A0ABW1ZCI4_9BACT|nr:protein translocase subunit SecD [Granulicella cerasi]
MGKNLAIKTWAIIGILIVFLYGIFGIPHGSLKQSITDRIHLGLDLRGGTHLVLQVQVAEAISSATDRDLAALTTALSADGATVSKADPTAHPDTLTVNVLDPSKLSDVRSVITGTSYSSTYAVESTTNGFTMKMTQAAQRDLSDRTLETSIETIRQRIDSLGVSEPVIEKYGVGENEILVELPGVSDLSRVEGIIQSTAKLEIHEVVTGSPYPDAAQALTAVGGVLPPDESIIMGSATGNGPDQAWVLKRASIVEGTDFRGATTQQDANGRPDIGFTLTTEAGERFYKYTDANKGTGQMAIVLENKVREVATIQSAIRDQGQITGGFSQQQADDLSLMLRTGSLPASIKFLESHTVGPSLGVTSIHQGVTAAVAGLVVVMLFMLLYYKGAGINADLALLLNLVILLGFMGFTGATLTLPGIAGVILTIGMGVDSNVLIFERVREELRLGKSAASAIEDGFGHAWTTIFDTHVTTIVSAGILFMFGTGPVKGFAVTLVFGLIANLFTAVFVSRVIFDYLLEKRGREATISI